MNFVMDYKLAMSCGLFIGSIFLMLGRITGYPISCSLLAIVLSSLSASFLYNPSSKNESKHRTLRGTGASFFFCLFFSIALTMYYIPKFNNVLGTGDMSMGASILIILLITLIGGIILGTIGGSIGSTLRDVVSVITSERGK